MTGERYSEPFFDQAVARLTKGAERRSIVRTPLDALNELDREPSLEPCGLIIHMDRCGSTLLARLLDLLPGPAPISWRRCSALIALRAIGLMMEKQARYHAKSLVAAPFKDDNEWKRAVPQRA